MHNPYAQVDVQTASPVQLVAKLYEGAIRHCRRGREAGDLGQRAESSDRALAIVGELRRSLSVSEGGEVARNLDSLYVYALDRIMAGNRGELRGFDDAVRVLEPLRGAWAELATRPPDSLTLER